MGHHRDDRRHHGDRTSATSTPAAGGKRKAVKPGRSSRSGATRSRAFRLIPSVPVMIGAAALAVSAGGAATVDAALTPTAVVRPASASAVTALNGVSAVGSVGTASRGAEVSRDSSRDAQQDAAGEELTEAAEQQAVERNAALSKLASAAEAQSKKLKADTWVLPVSGYHITNTFGMARSYYSSGYHTGLDFAVASGTPIHAIASGTIESMGYEGSYGNQTVMTLEDGTEIWYCHQTGFASGVGPGDTVTAGEVIGYVGSTGNSTGPHVHIEVRPGGGDPVDPFPAFVHHGVTP